MSTHSVESNDNAVQDLSRTRAKALEQMVNALKLLDESDAPAEIGATLDQAIHRLREAIRS